MAPENNTSTVPGAGSAAAVPIRQNVSVPKPDAGAEVSITSSAGGQLQLDFDPGAATTSRSGNDLSFQVDGGGTVTVKDFFAVGDESLPSLRLPDGTVVASTDFFSGSGLDMTTAAGPGGGGGAGGGSGDYRGDPGDLLGGIDRFGKLGTDFWGRGSEVPEAMRGLERPGGTFDMPTDTDLGGLFAAGVFEDARPTQHTQGDNAALNAAQIHFNFTPSGTTVVDAIRLSGFDPGTRIYIGDPANGGYEVFPDAKGVYHFTPDQFNATGGSANPGVYLVPPENSDHDMNISAQVDIHAQSSGVNETINGGFTIIVDAVADKPDIAAPDAGIGMDGYEGAMKVEETDKTQQYKDGWAEDSVNKTAGGTPDASEVTLTVKFSATLTFGDFGDGSERHFALVEVPSNDNIADKNFEAGDWIFKSGTASEGLTYYDTVTIFYVNGTAYDSESDARAHGWTDGGDSRTFFRFEVDNDYLQQHLDPHDPSKAVIDVEFEMEGTGSGITGDTQFNLEAGAQAKEEPGGSGELDLDNNNSYTWASDGGSGSTVPLDVDTVDSTLTLKAGWVAEDNNPDKNVPSGSSQGSGKWTDQSYEGETDNNKSPDAGSYNNDGKGAPLSLSISGGTLPDGSDAGEHITGVSFTFDPEQAIFRVGDVELTAANPTYTDLNGITYSYDASTGTVTISHLPPGMTDMSGLGMNFVPNVQYSDEDIQFRYTVDVESSSGAKAHYSGESTVVVDAVADLSKEVTSSIEGADASDPAKYTEAGTDKATLVTSDETGGRAGDSVEDFHDAKGWETDTYKLNYSEVQYTFTLHVETSFPDTDGSEKHYILVEKPGGAWELGDLPSGLKYPDGDDTITIDGKTYWKLEVTDPELKDVSVDIPLKGTGITGDTTLTLQTGSYVEEQNKGTSDDNREYDLTNNTAVRTDGTSVTYTIDVLNSQLTVKTGWASEGGNDAKHLGNANGAGYQVTGDYKDSTGASGTAYDGSAPITLSLSGAAGSAETIRSITVSFDDSRGSIWYNGAEYHSGATITLTTGSTAADLYFKPAPGYDYSDVKLDYSVTVGNTSGSEYEFTGSSQIVIDAVADKPTLNVATNGSQVDYQPYPEDHPQAGKEQAAAKPGDTVTVHGKVTFPDASGGENHFILIETGKNAGDPYDLQSITITAGGQTLELTAAQIQSMLMAGTITTVTVGGVTYYQIPTDGNFTDAGKIASFDVDITIKTSGESTHNNTVGFGGRAEVAEVGTSGGQASNDYEFDIKNNVADTVGSVTVSTQVVDTKEVTITVGSAYENADRDANKGFVARADMLDADGRFKPEYLADIKADSAAITIGAVNGNEDLIGLAIKIPTGSGGFLLGDAFFMPGDAGGTVTLGGIEISVSWTTGDDGNPILNITVPAGGSGDLSTLLNGNLWFVPGENFSSEDVKLEFGAVVEDNSSGYAKGFGDGDMAKELGKELGIDTGNSNDWAQNTGTVGGADHTAEVDAVAQQAGMEATVESIYNGDHVVPGTNATVHLDVDLRGDITDGTESHFFMVEAKPGYGIVTITITYEDADGITRLATLTADEMTLQPCGGNMYFQYDLGKLNPAIGDSELKIDVTLKTPGGQADGTSGSISMGVISHEEWSKITSGGDQEATLSNNTANALTDVEIPFSSCTRAGITLGGYVYENDNWNAHIGDTTTENRVVTLNISLGDANDYATDFHLELRGDDKALGDLVVYDSDGNELFRGDEITLAKLQEIAESDPKWADCLDKDGNLVKIPGAIVFEPADDSYSGKDPQIDYTITLRDDASGQTQTLSSEKGDPVLTITSDSVAQQPSDLHIADGTGESGTVVIDGTPDDNSFTKTISATFTDVDGSTTHYILIEAEAGWTITVNGKTYTPESTDDMFVHDGKVYYKIDVTEQVEHNASGHSGSASIDVTFTPPTDDIFFHAGGTRPGEEQEYSIDVKAGSTDQAEGKEITFDNNTAVIDGGSVSGVLTHEHTGHVWYFEQTAPVYEDNKPYQHLGSDDPRFAAGGDLEGLSPDSTVGGTFEIGYAGADYIIITDPDLVISGPGVTDFGNGSYRIELDGGIREITVSLSEEYLNNGGTNSDKDLNFDRIEAFDKDDKSLGTIGDTGVVVDAVADYAKVDVSSETSYDANPATDLQHDAVVADIDSGKDAVARFTVEATFNDTADGSERQYLLVEKTPAWSIDADKNPDYTITEVYIDGKTYYRLEVTGKTGPFEIAATYHGGYGGVDANGGALTSEKDGVTTYDLKVGAMTQEGKFDGVEFDTGNNTSINLENSVTLQYSPIDSQGGMSISHTVVNEWGGEHGMQAVTLAITGIETGKSDVLTDLTINYTQSAGQLYLVGSDGTRIAVSDGFNGFTDEQLAKLSSQEYTFSFEPNEHSHEDVGFSWSGTVKDTVSGASETVGGSQKLVVDAVADGSDNAYAVSSGDGLHGSVTSGAAAVVTVTADFKDNTSGSEEHWVVLEQNDLRYSVKGVEVYDDQGNLVKTYGPDALVTKFDAAGKPYWALNVSDIAGVGQDDCTVKFTVTTPEVTVDTDHTLGAGTIVIETSRDGQGGDSEPDYSDNWTSDIKDVTISTAVVEATTIKVEAASDSIEEDGSMKLTFTVPDSDGTDSIKDVTIKVPADGTLIVDGQEYYSGSVRITADQLDNVYFKPNADWSGEVRLDITAGTLTDLASGAEKAATTLIDGSFTVLPVADTPVNVSHTADFSVNDGGLFEVTLAASLTDIDGSESLWFKVFVPEGLHLTDAGSYAFDAGGGYYLVPADVGANGAGTAHLAFTADSTWDSTSGNTITYHAMSQEGADTANTADSAPGAIIIDHDFDYRTEHLAAGDSGDFSTVAHNLHITGSDGNDTIHGGAGNDIIYGGAGNDILNGGTGDDIIYGVAGNNIIHGGSGNDVMYGGTGNDTFLWLAEDFGSGANDTIHNFQLGHDVIQFKDVFGTSADSIDTLLNDADYSVTNTVRFTHENNTTFEAKFTSDSELLLTLKDASGNTQIIEVHAADGTSFDVSGGIAGDFNEEAAKQILQEMLKSGSI